MRLEEEDGGLALRKDGRTLSRLTYEEEDGEVHPLSVHTPEEGGDGDTPLSWWRRPSRCSGSEVN